jgi:hypothetical protein
MLLYRRTGQSEILEESQGDGMTASSTLQHLAQNWKTTLAGVLNTVVALSAAGFFAPNPFINTKLSGYFLAASTMANIVLHVMMLDGNTTNLTLPTSGAGLNMNIPAGSTASVKTPEKP